MATTLRSSRTLGAGLLLLSLLALLITWMAPVERTLGEGIRVVYLHVGLIWTGMFALFLAGVLGLLLLITGRPPLRQWMEAVAWVGFGFYAASGLVSLVAQQVNWGGIAWQEPRTVAMLQLLALAVIVRVLNSWLTKPSFQAVLNAALAGVMLWSSLATPLQLHPDNPVGTSSSQAIRLAFYLLFAVFALAAAWLSFYVRSNWLASWAAER